MSDNIEKSWPSWKIALAVAVPVVIGAAGVYYYTHRSGGDKIEDTQLVTPRIEPEGSSSPKKESNVVEVKEDSKTTFQQAQDFKNEGNKLFKQGKYKEAIIKYSEAITVCPQSHNTEKSTYHQNKAAALEKMENWEAVLEECTKAVTLNQRYVKALYRRSKAFEKLGQKENCLEDITTVCILEGFQNNTTMMFADDVLKQIGREKASEKYKNRKPMVPSSVFIKQYFESFHDDVISQHLSEQDKQKENESGYIRAKIAFDNENFDKVIELCNEEINQEKEAADYVTEALLLRATFYLLTGNIAEAEPDLNKIIDTKDACIKLRANALIKRGSLKMQQQNPKEASQDFDLAVQVDPNNSDVFHHRGQLHILLDNVQGALEDFNKCIEINPDFAMAHAQRCYTLYRQAVAQNDVVLITKATYDFQVIIDKYPKCSETYGLYAQAQSDTGNFDKADELFATAISIEPENATLYVHRGLLQMQWKQDVEEAIKFISKALEVDYKCDFAHETMGTIEVQRGNLPKATLHFGHAIDFSKSELEMAHLFALQAAAVAQGNITQKYGLRPPMPGMM